MRDPGGYVALLGVDLRGVQLELSSVLAPKSYNRQWGRLGSHFPGTPLSWDHRGRVLPVSASSKQHLEALGNGERRRKMHQTGGHGNGRLGVVWCSWSCWGSGHGQAGSKPHGQRGWRKGEQEKHGGLSNVSITAPGRGPQTPALFPGMQHGSPPRAGMDGGHLGGWGERGKLLGARVGSVCGLAR